MVVTFARDLERLEPPKFDADSSSVSPLQQEELRKKIKNIEKKRLVMETEVQEEIVKTCEGPEIGLTKFFEETASNYKLQKGYVKEMY